MYDLAEEIREVADHLRHPDVTLYALTDDEFCETYGLDAEAQGRTLYEFLYEVARRFESYLELEGCAQ